MPRELKRLLSSHWFLQQALTEYGAAMTDAHLEGLRAERDRVFNELVDYSSIYPQVTLAQLRFLVSGLAELAANRKQAEALQTACMATAERLAASGQTLSASHTAAQTIDEVAAAAGDASPAALQFSALEMRLLDGLADRASVTDLNARYIYTNRANATFHHRTPADMLGKHVRLIVGRRRFEEVTQPALEKCYRGQAVIFPVSYAPGNGTKTFSVSCEPIRSDAGAVVGMICIARDITSHSPKPGVIYQVPSEV